MAGIGFRLQKLLDEGTYYGALKGFFFATYLVAGPWIVTVAIIGLLTWFSGLGGRDYDIFRTSVVYLYAFSLIFTGFYQMPLTRRLADELYAGRVHTIAPSFLGMVFVTTLIMGTGGFLYALLLPLSWLYRCTFSAGLTIVSLLWLCGIYLSCLRDFEKIGLYYTLGSLVSFCGTLIGERALGLDGAFLGFVIGQALILFGLCYRILRELGQPGLTISFECLSSLREFKVHLFAGLFYNIAIWIDKCIYWYTEPYSQEACRGLYSFGHYDTSIYLAYITIIPALGQYLLNIETQFYETYRDFFGAIMRQFPLETIIRRQEDITRTLKFTFFEMIKLQGAITFLCYYFTPEILAKIHYPLELTGTVRWGLWAAFFQVLFLFVSLTLLYFEFAREALIGNALYLLINSLVTWYIAQHGWRDYYAAGYFFSTFIAFLVVTRLLQVRLRRLIFLTFMKQPIPGEVHATPPLLGPDGRIGEIIHPAPPKPVPT